MQEGQGHLVNEHSYIMSTQTSVGKRKKCWREGWRGGGREGRREGDGERSWVGGKEGRREGEARPEVQHSLAHLSPALMRLALLRISTMDDSVAFLGSFELFSISRSTSSYLLCKMRPQDEAPASAVHPVMMYVSNSGCERDLRGVCEDRRRWQ